jgi:Ca2+-binding RTX toxin-like protein
VLDLSATFADVDILTSGDSLTFLIAGNTNPGVITATLVGTTLTLEYADDQHGAATITVRATDASGEHIETSFDVTVSSVNDAPTAAPLSVVVTEDGAVTFTLSGSDGETPLGNLRFTIESLPEHGTLRTLDGTAVEVGQTFVGPPSLTYEPGIACDSVTGDGFTFTVIDNGDGSSPPVRSAPAGVSIVVTPAVAEGAVTIDDQGIVRIGGTSAADVIRVTRTSDGSQLQVSIGGGVVSNTIPLADVSEIRVWGREGNDRLQLIDLAINALIHGGAGNDEITGGAGHDLIFGGGGNDTLTGAAGNDFLIGGDGADRIVGSAGHDILVAADVGRGFTSGKLRAISADWVGNRTLDPDAVDEVLDETLIDDDLDMLTGSSGSDWFIIGGGDKVTDFKKQSTDGDLVTIG